MSKFTDFIDGLKDEAGKLAKAELKALVKDGKKEVSDFVRLQAKKLEDYTVLLADGELTPRGYKKLVRKMEVVAELESIRLKVKAKAAAQRLQTGIQDYVINGLFKLL